MAVKLAEIVTGARLRYFYEKCKASFAAKSDVPTDTNDLTNGAGYITGSEVDSKIDDALGVIADGSY